MGAIYRPSRNIEATLIEFLETQLASGGWTGITVEKGYARVYTITLPVICVRVETTDHDSIEIGSRTTKRIALVTIDLFCKNDGQRLDLKDFLVSILKDGCPYYKFVTTTTGRSTAVSTRTADGKLVVLNIEDVPVEFETPKSELTVHDRYRHRLSVSVNKTAVEA